MARRRHRALAAIAALSFSVALVAGCSPVPVPPSERPSASLTLSAPATPGPATLEVAVSGTVDCAMFPYGCVIALSVAKPTSLGGAWRPAPSDPQWWPEYSSGPRSRIDPTVHGRLPPIPPGDHTLVVSILGSYDVVELNPDGSVRTDLLGRCRRDVTVPAAAQRVLVTVEVTPRGPGFETDCSISAEVA